MEAAAVFGRRSATVQENAPAANKSQIRNFKKIRHSGVLTSRPDQSSWQEIVGVLQAPQPPPLQLFHSSYPPLPLQKQPQLQPPLLPLPAASYPLHRTAAIGLPCPPGNHKKINNNSSRTSKIQKSFDNNTNNTKKLESALSPKTPLSTIPSSSPPLRPKINVTEILSFHSDNYNYVLSEKFSSLKVVEEPCRGTISGNYDLAAFPLTISSPPPSSLPLPTFSLRSSKLCYDPEATRTDTGATHNLRRLLGLP